MNRRRRLAIALAVALSACGGASRPVEAPAARSSGVTASPGSTEELRTQPGLVAQQPELPMSPSPTQPTVQAAPPATAATPTRPGDLDAPDHASGDAVSMHEATIRRNEATLAASLGDCRVVCAAAGNICVAAGEICRLTGDHHPRCERARSSCADAGRRRDGTCPTCPSPR